MSDQSSPDSGTEMASAPESPTTDTKPQKPKMVAVHFGTTNKTVSPGKTIRDAASVVDAKSKWFGLNKPAVYLNGILVTNWGTVLGAGDDVEFTKATGGKG